MQNQARARLVDALAAWGAHEAPGRGQQQFPGQIAVDTNDPIACLEFILWFRSRVIAHLLAREPVMTIKTTFNASDISKLVLFDGRTVATWIAETNNASGGESHQHFNALVQGTRPLSGSLLVGAQMVAPPPALQIRHQILYEGWHRAAAIVQRAQAGLSDTIDAYIVLAAK
jgi:hypothetical protein